MGKTVSQSQSKVNHKKLTIGKLLTRIGLGILAVILIIYLGRNFLIKTAIQTGVQKALGMKVSIAEFKLDLIPVGKLEIKGLTVYNPPGFQGESLIKIPYIRADFDLAPFLIGKFHFKYLDLNINEVNLIKNRNKELNLNRIQTIASTGSKSPPKSAPNKPTAIRINELILTIDHVNYIDYTGQNPKQRRIRLGIYRERFANLKSVDDIVKVVVVRVVYKAGLYNLGLPIRALGSGINQIGNSIGDKLNKSSKGVDKFFNKLFKKKK